MEQEIKLIVLCHGVLTRVVGPFIVLEPLGQIGLAFALWNMCAASSSLQWPHTLCAPVGGAGQRGLETHETGHTPIARLGTPRDSRHQAKATIGGHADAVEAMIAQVVKMGFPGLGPSDPRPVEFQNGRALRLNRDQMG